MLLEEPLVLALLPSTTTIQLPMVVLAVRAVTLSKARVKAKDKIRAKDSSKVKARHKDRVRDKVVGGRDKAAAVARQPRVKHRDSRCCPFRASTVPRCT